MELLIVVAIIAILATLGVLSYNSSLQKSAEALTKGNLGTIRSALSIYYTDNEGMYPYDDLTSMTNSSHYFLVMPITRVTPYHQDSILVTNETVVSETGGWSYNNTDSDEAWGSVHVGCQHFDSRGQVWSSY
jgi:general secretion pathway protein G